MAGGSSRSRPTSAHYSHATTAYAGRDRGLEGQGRGSPTHVPAPWEVAGTPVTNGLKGSEMVLGGGWAAEMGSPTKAAHVYTSRGLGSSQPRAEAPNGHGGPQSPDKPADSGERRFTSISNNSSDASQASGAPTATSGDRAEVGKPAPGEGMGERPSSAVKLLPGTTPLLSLSLSLSLSMYIYLIYRERDRGKDIKTSQINC